MKTLAPTTTREYLEFASDAAAGWSAAERWEWRKVVRRLSGATRGLNVRLPRILLVKTTGKEEFQGAYTRGIAIMIPERLASLPFDNERRAFFLLAHELFHVLSRFNPRHRSALYSLLGFSRIPAIDYPEELEEKRLSNPDAFSYRHSIPVNIFSADGQLIGRETVLPVNQSDKTLKEAILLDSVFEFVRIDLLPVASDGTVLREMDGSLTTYHFGNTDWVPKLARNSGFIVHPEEVMADNFASLMEYRATGEQPVDNPAGAPINDPALLKQINAVLTRGCGH